MRGRGQYLLAGSALALASAVGASETTTYSYDALGRLTISTTAGGPNNGIATGIAYDPAGNRSAYNVTGASASPPPASPPPGPPPAFSVSGGSANEGSAIIFTISRSNLTGGTFGISYATSNGTAAAYSDYYPASGTLTFTSSEIHKTVTVATIVDNMAEGAETVVMTLSNPTGGATVNVQAGGTTGTINASATNNPPTPVDDNVSIARCTAGSFNVVGNDADAEGDYPLSLIGVGGSALQMGYVSVGSTTSVAWSPASQVGTYPVDYIVKDSRNASSTGRLTVKVTGSGTGSCP